VSSNPLHFGGSMGKPGGWLSASGRLSPRPAPGKTFKEQQRYTLMAQMENAGIPEAAQAAMLCISKHRLQHLKQKPDYQIVRLAITHGIIVDHASKSDIIREQRKEMLTMLLPEAWQSLANEIRAKATTLAERKHKAAIVQDLLDREGTFAKVSRTEIKPVDAFDFERADEASRSIISAIRGVAPAPRAAGPMNPRDAVTAFLGEHTAAAIEANREFSNSHTLSAVDQQQALEALERAVLEDADTGAALLEAMPPTTESVQ